MSSRLIGLLCYTLRPTGQAETIVFENTALKANAQLTQANSSVASWSNGDKQWLGRGAGLDRPPETTWDQRGKRLANRVLRTSLST